VPVKFPVTSNLISRLFAGDESSSLQENANHEKMTIEITCRYLAERIKLVGLK
jgi:hypothetical protein